MPRTDQFPAFSGAVQDEDDLFILDHSETVTQKEKRLSIDLARRQLVRAAYVGTTDPGPNDDETQDYVVGNFGVNTATGELFALVDATAGAAVWANAGSTFTGLAEDVQYDNATSGLSATDVQAAIDEIAQSGGGGEWGSITGDLSNQTDLQEALDAKLEAGAELTLLSSGSAALGHAPRADGSGGITWAPSGGGGGGAALFTELLDTPSGYAGMSGRFVRVNTAENGLEFTSASPGGGGGLAVRHAQAGDFDFTGSAPPGSSESDPVWSVTRINFSTSPITVQHAVGAWTNRESLTYG